jgi:hypothetical protein
MRRITKESVVNRPSRELVKSLAFLKNEAFASKDMKVTHLGGSTVHQLIARSLLVDPEVNPVRHVACGIDRLSPEPSYSLMLIEHRPSHLTQGSIFPFHHAILGGVYGLDNWCSRPKSWQKVSKREFLSFEPLSLRITCMASLCLAFLNLKTGSGTKPNVLPFSSKNKTQAYRE